MNEFIVATRADWRRHVGSRMSPRQVLTAISLDVGLQALLVYRFGRLLRAWRRKPYAWPVLPFGWLLYLMAAELIRKCYDIRLALTADIGPGFWIGHFGGIELVNCRVGARCTVGQQSRVGSAAEADGPQVGEGVWIGAHARIQGRTRIGDGATIAPGAQVFKDIPSRALVVGNPGRVAARGYDNSAIVPGDALQMR